MDLSLGTIQTWPIRNHRKQVKFRRDKHDMNSHTLDGK